MKTCTKCGVEKDLSEYRKRSGTSKFHASCNDCQRDQQYRSKYGISLSDYTRMHQKQDGRCVICEQQQSTHMCVDHCHTTGQVRGLLCTDCNRALGLLKDDISNFQRAISYLRSQDQG